MLMNKNFDNYFKYFFDWFYEEQVFKDITSFIIEQAINGDPDKLFIVLGIV